MFVDWENVHLSIEPEGIWIDDVVLCQHLQSLGKQTQVYFYQVDHSQSLTDPPALSRKAQILLQMGVMVREKRLQEGFKKGGRIVRSGNLDVDLTIDVMDFLKKHGKYLKKVMLVTGDGDFSPLLVRIRQHRNENPISTTVLGWNKLTSHRLIRESDRFLTLDTILPKIKLIPDLTAAGL